MLSGVIGRTQSLPHAHAHEQLLGQFLLAESHGAAGHHDALPALVLYLGDLFDDAGQSSQSQAVFVLPGDHGAAELDHETSSVLELTALGEGGTTTTLAGLQATSQVHVVTLGN